MSRPLDSSLVVLHLDRMRSAARSLCRSPQEVEDLVQDTCVKLLAKDRRVRAGDELGYMLTALRNTHLNRVRAVAARPPAAGPAEAPEIADEGPAASTFDRVRTREVLGWVGGLPDESRQAVVAVDVVGLSRAEAAQSLGISHHALSGRLRRGHAGLAARLQSTVA